MLFILLPVVAIICFGIRRFLRGPIYQSSKRLDGKTVVVTGANSGIGYHTAKDLCRRGARVVMLCRSWERGNAALKQLQEELEGEPNVGTVVLEHLDLAFLKSVRICAAKLLDQEDRLDILVLNAGVMMTPIYPRTKNFFEMQMGSNHLGHFLLTILLMPLLKKTGREFNKARVISVSSMAHWFAKTPMRLHDLCWSKVDEFSPTEAYAQSKLANILFAKELGRRLKGSGITTYSLHPGVISTELYRHAGESSNIFAYYFFYLLCFKIGSFFIKTPWHGAQTTLYCCLDDGIKDETGRYYMDCGPKKPSIYAQSDEDARKLWDLSAKMTLCEEAKELGV